MADDPTIAELIDRLECLQLEQAKLIAKSAILHAEFEKLRQRCEAARYSPPKPRPAAKS
jgi:hypothetical protein